ncbi:hypothetical protein N431DRAFT_441969 [Stipitochalara longipes BDJ]|nr:hypothetical protein N431DRAFT_441969 [Stipitochalara longipes BDJ]
MKAAVHVDIAMAHFAARIVLLFIVAIQLVFMTQGGGLNGNSSYQSQYLIFLAVPEGAETYIVDPVFIAATLMLWNVLPRSRLEGTEPGGILPPPVQEDVDTATERKRIGHWVFRCRRSMLNKALLRDIPPPPVPWYYYVPYASAAVLETILFATVRTRDVTTAFRSYRGPQFWIPAVAFLVLNYILYAGIVVGDWALLLWPFATRVRQARIAHATSQPPLGRRAVMRARDNEE